MSDNPTLHSRPTLPQSRPRSYYEFKASAAGGAELWIYGEIEPTFGEVSAKDFIADLRMLGESEPLCVHIHSPGGSVFEGAAIANALKRHKGAVTTQIDGLCASIATVVALAGNHVRMAGNGIFMLHEPWTLALGSADDMRGNAVVLDKIAETIVATYEAKTGLPRQQIVEMMKAETWLSAEESKFFGFADEITEPLKAAASIADFDLTKFRNTPRNLSPNTPDKIMITQNKETEAAVAGERARIAELTATAEIIGRREKNIDVKALLERGIKEGWTSDAFCKAVLTSPEYSKIEVIGGGPEHGHGIPGGFNGNSIGAIVTRDPQFQALVRRGFSGDYNLAIPIEGHDRFRAALTSGNLGGIEIKPGINLLGQQRLTIADLIPQEGTNAPVIRYLQENTYTPAADMVQEGATKPQFVPDLTKVDASVKKIAVFVKVTEETLADYAQAATYLNERLPFMVMQKEEQQLLSGSGIDPNLLGIFNTPGVQTQAKGADTRADAMFKALTNIRVNSHQEPTGYVVHPRDWETLRLSKDAANQYYGGGPFIGSYGQPISVIDMLWNKPVAITTAITQGTALAGAFDVASRIFRRQGLVLQITNSDQDDFIKNLVTMRAEQREALAVYFGNAFCQITGL